MDLDLATEEFETLSERVRQVHDRILEIDPRIDRVACALYDPGQDMLKTFLNSTRESHELRAYQYRLSDSQALSYLARSREVRHLEDIPSQIVPTTQHSSYVLEEGYQSSFTVPMYSGQQFFGFVFFDSRSSETFSIELQRELALVANLLTLTIEHEVMTVRAIVDTVQLARDVSELRDLETGAHLERMSRYARVIAQQLAAEFGHDDEWVERVFLYAPLHDLGKIGIPDHILLKPGSLGPEEWEVMKSHTTKGAEMIDHMSATLGIGSSVTIEMARNIAIAHHEALDGSGYPRGLKGEEIPLEARIASVADIYDALTTKRSYKPAWDSARALELLWKLVGSGKLDERCVEALAGQIEEVREITASFGEPEPPSSPRVAAP